MSRQERKLQELPYVGKVSIYHMRLAPDGELYPPSFFKKNKIQPLPRGGATFVDIFNKAGVPIAFGKAICSEKDGFNRRLGRSIALGRALKCLSN